ncbi:MAG: O-methyltransferase [Gemmatimonadota bacterium]
MSTEETSKAVDGYVTELCELEDEALEGARVRSRGAGLPGIEVSPAQGAFLEILARAAGARRVLEIGTLGGYSSIFLARSLPPGGIVTTLERDPEHASVARTNLEAAGLADRVEVLEGPALQTLDRLRAEAEDPFDLVFIDADKTDYAEYLAAVLPLSRPGTLIVADNVVRKGAVADPTDADPRVVGARRFLEAMARDPRLRGTVVQTVGRKGHDGMAVAVVLGNERYEV